MIISNYSIQKCDKHLKEIRSFKIIEQNNFLVELLAWNQALTPCYSIVAYN